ncbi:FecR family protein [Bacteroides caccae]|uniref:FecR family protein n=1 Tax=Bacteroides caccae TaxID=47678 RepID=UPI00356A8785
MMELHEKIDESLLFLYFSGTLGEKERKEVETWISLSEENRKMARQICYIHHVTGIIDTVKKIDSKQALSKLNKRLERKERLNWWEWGVRAAAVLFIPLFLSLFYFIFNQDKNNDRYVEIRSNPGMKTKVELPDGTWVWLNSGSYLKYPVSFEKGYRKVELKGEAYFSVQKDNGRKFLVDVGKGVELEVLGTEFNVDAYPDDEFVAATLVTGRVNFHCQQRGKEATYSMQPGQKVIYKLLDEKLLCTAVSFETDIAWRNGKIIYRDTPLEEALRILSKNFDVEFRINNPLLKKYCFTGIFINQRLDRILEHFKIASGVRYRYLEPTLNKDIVTEKTIIEIY